MSVQSYQSYHWYQWTAVTSQTKKEITLSFLSEKHSPVCTNRLTINAIPSFGTQGPPYIRAGDMGIILSFLNEMYVTNQYQRPGIPVELCQSYQCYKGPHYSYWYPLTDIIGTNRQTCYPNSFQWTLFVSIGLSPIFRLPG